MLRLWRRASILKKDWGHVWTVEIVPDLAEVGRKNVERTGYSQRVTFIEGDAVRGT